LRRFLCFLIRRRTPLGACYQLKMSSHVRLGQLHRHGSARSQKSGGFGGHTDFVFAIVGEEGAGRSLLRAHFFIVFVYRGLRVAYRHPDPFGQLLAAGLTLTIAMC
jgi:cell division protein FtsW